MRSHNLTKFNDFIYAKSQMTRLRDIASELVDLCHLFPRLGPFAPPNAGAQP